MAALMGKDGSMKIGAATVGVIDSWTLNPQTNTAEVTAYGDKDRQYVYTIKQWSGTASGTLDLADAQQLTLADQFDSVHTLAVAALRFYTTTGVTTYWSGNAYMQGLTVNSAVADKVSVSFNFTGDGNLSYTTAGV
jgi:hypothetical protein